MRPETLQLSLCFASLLVSYATCTHVYLHELQDVFRQYRETKGYVVIYIFDEPFANIAHNLVANMYQLDIHNTIGAVKHAELCNGLEEFTQDKDIMCSSVDPSQYPNITDVSESIFRTDKSLIGKNFMYFYVIHALQAGLDVLYVDADVVFLQYPDNMMTQLRSTVDVALKLQSSGPRWDMNAGLFYARANDVTIDLFMDLWDRIVNETRKQLRREKSHNFEQQMLTDSIETKLGDRVSIRLTYDQDNQKPPTWVD
eukprot:gene6085-7306_t